MPDIGHTSEHDIYFFKVVILIGILLITHSRYKKVRYSNICNLNKTGC